MEISKESFDLLSGVATRRKDHQKIQNMDLMAALYRGKLPSQYDKYQPKSSFPIIPNIIKNAWDDISSSVGKAPELRADAMDETQAEEKRVGLLERIAYSYLKDAEPTTKVLLKRTAWWLAGTGNAVVIVTPDDENKKPVISYRDPRGAMPNMRTVDGIPVELYDILFEREIPVATAIELGLAPKDYQSTAFAVGQAEPTMKVYEFIDDTAWTVVSEAGMGTRTEHNLGVCPAWYFQSFNPDEEGGLSLFEQQVSLMVGVSVLMSMKIAGADKMVNPIYYAKGHQGTIKIGPNQLNKLSPSGEMGMLHPAQVPQVDRDIDQLVAFSNILNKNPEVRQGQVDTKGAYQSQATLEELASAVDNTIDDYWDIMSFGFKKILYIALCMDEKLYGNEEKHISLNVKGKKYRDTYVPSKDIDGHYDVNVDYGFGLGGYQGFLQNLQANQAKVRSRKAAIEAMPGVSDVEREVRQIQLEDLSDAQMANLMSQAANGALDMVFMAKLQKAVAKGKPLDETILKLTEEAQAQAAAAAQTEGISPVTAEAPPEEAAPEAAPLPGLNPAAVV